MYRAVPLITSKKSTPMVQPLFPQIRIETLKGKRAQHKRTTLSFFCVGARAVPAGLRLHRPKPDDTKALEKNFPTCICNP